jgi:hypothetical protein
MTPAAMHVVIFALLVMALMRADNSTFSTANRLPLPQTATIHALSEAQAVLTESILSKSGIRLSYYGTPNIPLEDISLGVKGISLTHLTNLHFRSSPFHMTSVKPDLRLMALNLRGSIDTLEVTGNYNLLSYILRNHEPHFYGTSSIR